MKLRINSTALLAVVALGVGIYELIQARGSGNAGVPAAILLIVALLLTMRYLMRLQRRHRERMIQEVPRNPLGLREDEADPPRASPPEPHR